MKPTRGAARASRDQMLAAAEADLEADVGDRHGKEPREIGAAAALARSMASAGKSVAISPARRGDSGLPFRRP